MDKPVLFNGPMVRAILEGRKTQTRRPLRNQPEFLPTCLSVRLGYSMPDDMWFLADQNGHTYALGRLPYAVGDRMYVRETFYRRDEDGIGIYAADDTMFFHPSSLAGQMGRMPQLKPDDCREPHEKYGFKKIPSIHMPKCASRIWLTVTGCRVERLQDISEADAIAEGVCSTGGGRYRIATFDAGFTPRATAVEAYADLWDAQYGKTKHAWKFNPWVSVTEFERAKD